MRKSKDKKQLRKKRHLEIKRWKREQKKLKKERNKNEQTHIENSL